MILRKYLNTTETNKIKTKINSSSSVSLKYHSVGLILILIILKKILEHVSLISTGKCIKGMTKHKLKIVMGPLFVSEDWRVRVFWSSGIVDRPSKRLYVLTIPLSGCMDRHFRYTPFSSKT